MNNKDVEIIEAEFSEVEPVVDNYIEAEYIETTENSIAVIEIEKETIEATVVGGEEVIGGYNVVSEEEHINNSHGNIVFESKLDPNPQVNHETEPIAIIIIGAVLFFTAILIF